MGRGNGLQGALLRALNRRDGRGAHLWVCKEYEHGEARRKERRAVGMRWTAERTRVSPSPHPWRLSYRRGRTRGRVRLNKEGREP
jgi:hypothetical protein